jgi:tetrathionate reductase subunit B
MKNIASDFSELDTTSRRKFLQYALSGAATILMVQTSAVSAVQGRGKGWKQMSTEHQYAYVIDINKCIGWGGCVRACRQENDVPEGVFRTWVERYVLTEDGVYVDSPKGGAEGFEPVSADLREKAKRSFFVPKMCNHCENPPCVQVCPVGATYQTVEGVVLVDRDWCMGCAYCIMACPFGARYFHPELKVADKCTFCYHRINKGLQPACVQSCAFGARRIANLRDPDDPVTKIITSERVAVLKDLYGTKPHAFYLGLDHDVR